MDDATDIHELLDDLSENIDDLETAIKPLLSQPISTLSSKLSPLEKAKLYTWLTYTIETILFSHIRLNGTEDPKSHPVFTELRRVQQYMQKVQQAENPVGKRENLSLNKEAAGRFIKAGLAGNDRYDQEVAERKAREAEGARRKLEELNRKRKADNAEGEDSSSENAEDVDRMEIGQLEGRKKNKNLKLGTNEEGEAPSSERKKKKKKRDREQGKGEGPTIAENSGVEQKSERKKKSKKSKRNKESDGVVGIRTYQTA